MSTTSLWCSGPWRGGNLPRKRFPASLLDWSGEKTSRIFSKPLSQAGVNLLGFVFCSALSALSLGRAQMWSDVAKLVEQVLQPHLCAGLEPKQGQSCSVGVAVPAGSTGGMLESWGQSSGKVIPLFLLCAKGLSKIPELFLPFQEGHWAQEEPELSSEIFYLALKSVVDFGASLLSQRTKQVKICPRTLGGIPEPSLRGQASSPHPFPALFAPPGTPLPQIWGAAALGCPRGESLPFKGLEKTLRCKTCKKLFY